MRRAFQRCAASLPRALSTSTNTQSALQSVRNVNVTSKSLAQASASLRSIHQSSIRRQESEPKSSDGEDSVITKFADLATKGLVHENVIRALTSMGLETMTEVQTASINEALRKTDIIALAKTGTGKTVGFLLPVLQNIIKSDPHLAEPSRGRRGPRATADDIRALIVSPTRELAEQIAEEARKVCRNTGIIVQTAVGGTQKRLGMRAIQQQGCHLLVGTPGRLKDILSDPYSKVEAPDLSALVFDEADRLMDQGFWPEIQEIMHLLPARAERDRQTLMFSATIPKDVVTLARNTLKPGFKFVKTIKEDEAPTHERVPQNLLKYNRFENAMPALIELCLNEINSAQAGDTAPFKAIVYFNSTAEVQLAYSLLSSLDTAEGRNAFGPTRVIQIHAKLAQAQRTRAAEKFKQCTSGILLSTDVTARGMDFPGVTHVIQMGLASDRDTYIHRIGRTARAGREGTGWLFVSEIEANEINYKLGKLPLKANDSITSASLDLSKAADISASTGKILSMYQAAIQQVPRVEKVKAFMAMFGTFGWFNRKQQLVDNMNALAQYGWGMPEPPAMSAKLIQRLPGMRHVTGIRIGRDPEDMDDESSSGGRPSFGRSGGPSGGFNRVGPNYGRSSGGGFTGRGSRSADDMFTGRGRTSSGGSNYGADRGGYGGARGDRGGGRSDFGGGRSDYGGGRREFGGGDRYGGGDRSDRGPPRERSSRSYN